MATIPQMMAPRLNPSAPMFVPESYRSVDDFSEKWWAMVSTSPSFRDYWLEERFVDPSDTDESETFLEHFFDSENSGLTPNEDIIFQEEDGDSKGRKLVKLNAQKWPKVKDYSHSKKSQEKAPMHVQVKMSPRMIQQPK